MKYKVLISTVFCIIQAGVTLDAQDSGVPPSMYPNQPASPQAEAMARLGVYEMNNPMGMPDITIPLFDIEHHGFHIPLKLKYEAQPLKPGYNYDVFGKGWTMTGQSCVSRTIRSVADETRDFKLDSDQLEKSIYLSYIKNPFEYIKNYNFQYDIFNAVLPDGRTFDFFMHKDSGNKMVYELSNGNADIKINCSFTSNNIDSFTITDEEGVVYGFSVADKATNDWINLKRSNVTWLLSSIGLPNGGTIYYTYNDLKTIRTYTIDEPVLTFGQVYPYQTQTSQGSLSVESPYYFRLDLQPTCSIYEMRFLKKISYGATSVNFSYKPDGQHLSEIKIVDSGNVIRKIAFNIPDGGISLNTLTFSGDNNTDRLVYKFNYTGYSSSSYTDHWGNYGNAGKNTDIGNFNFFIDDIGGSLDDRNGTVIGCVRVLTKNSSDIQSFHKLKSQISASGDSRTATSPDNHCILRTITYPNGGSTHFEFENHRFVTASNADGALEPDRRKQRIIEGGGFRIRSVINYSADGTLADRREYRYGYTFREIDAGHFPLPRLAGAEADRHIGIYEDGRLNKILVDGGYVDYNGGNPIYNAYLTDHQGNTRMVVSEGAAVRQVDHYYPYGALMAAGPHLNVQRYLYNGKELDRMHGLDWYDYGARHYDAAIGRWHSMDEMCDAYYDISPYAYCGGDPVNAIDPDGNIIIFVNGMHFGDGGKPKYWNGVDITIMQHLKDNKAVYIDGAFGGFVNTLFNDTFSNNLKADNRKKMGTDVGGLYAKSIYENLSENETIKIISHSMGGAAAKGFLQALLKYAKDNNLEHKVSFELDLAPFQWAEQKGNLEIPTYTISHKSDRVAREANMKNAINFHPEKEVNHSNPLTGHKVETFEDEVVRLIREGKIETSVKY